MSLSQKDIALEHVGINLLLQVLIYFRNATNAKVLFAIGGQHLGVGGIKSVDEHLQKQIDFRVQGQCLSATGLKVF